MAEAQTAQIEYTIYTSDLPSKGQKSKSSWKKHATLDDMNKAVAAAENLQKSEKYEKIEVKKVFFDPKTNRKVDMTLKTLEFKPKKDFTILIVMTLAIILGIGAFAVTFLMSQ